MQSAASRMTYVDRNHDIASAGVRLAFNVAFFHVVQDSSLVDRKKRTSLYR
jgi:hypothetical protein